MTLNLSPSSLVNAGGAFLFVLLGVAILALARRRGALLSATCIFFGLTYVFENLVVPDAPAAMLLVAASPAALLPCQAALVLRLARPLAAPARRALGLFALANVALLALLVALLVQDHALAARMYGLGVPAHPLLTTLVSIIMVTWSGFLLVAAASALRARAAPEPRERRAYVLLALAFGLFGAFVITFLTSSYALFSVPDETLLVGGLVLHTASVPLAVLFLVPGPATPEPRLFRRASLALAAAGLAGFGFVALPLLTRELLDFGSFGIVRTLGAALLGVAILRHDLLGVRLPRLATRRGPLAASALALLFVVAQVAQNFLEAEYGFLLGGVVAGAFLFAANPIQRAIEGGRLAAAAPLPDEKAQRRREMYGTAVRAALTKHALTREEERALAHLAEELGIGAGEAHDIRVRAEEEAKARSP